MFNTDKPICSINEDKLGRAQFAKRLAETIISFQTEDSYTIALQGKWGCGKTSVLNMTVEEIKKANQETKADRIIIVRFNPWNFTDTTQLINQFFLTLSNTLQIDSKEKNFKKLGDLIENYSAALEYAEYLPGIGKYLKILPKLSENFGERMRSKSEDKLSNVSYQRELVEKELKNLKKRILIIIDDIDRLPDVQIRLIFQLVNSVAGFPYTTYLVSFDKDIVSRALSSVQSGNGNDYLEKIIQFPFNMPCIKQDKLNTILFERLSSIAFIPNGMNFDSSRWTSVFNSCILPFIKTLRDVHRFCNTLSFSYSAIKEEVDFIDMAGICSLQLFAPSIYEWIRDNGKTLTGGYQGGGISLNGINERQKDIVEQFKIIYPQNPNIMVEAISSLFPAFSNRITYVGNFKSSSDLHQEMRISDERKFNLYFSLSLEDISISRSELDYSLFYMNEEQLSEYISELDNRKMLSEYMTEFRLHLSRIPEERIQLFVNLFVLRTSKQFTNSEDIGFSISPFSVYTLSELLFRLDSPDKRFTIIKNLFLLDDFSVFQFLLHLLQIIELSYGKIVETRMKNEPKLITEDDLSCLEQIFIMQLSKFLNIVPLLDWKEAKRVALLWEFIDKSGYTTYIKEIIKDDFSAMKFLRFYVGIWKNGNNICEYELQNNTYMEYISTEEALVKIERARTLDCFWTFNEDMPGCIAAFSLFYKNIDVPISKVDIELVEEKVNTWKREFEATTNK